MLEAHPENAQGSPRLKAFRPRASVLLLRHRFHEHDWSADVVAAMSVHRANAGAGIIPVRLDGSRMPSSGELPEGLSWFPYLNAVAASRSDIRGSAAAIAKAARDEATLDEPRHPVSLARLALQNLAVPRSLLDGNEVRNIFLSYRRKDSAAASRWLHRELSKHIEGVHVFRDVDSIPLGIDFIKVLEDEVARCDIFVVVIGPEWMRAVDAAGNRMLDRPGDFVRLEIELALARGVPIVIALVGGAPDIRCPPLPPSIHALATCPTVPMHEEGSLTELCGIIRKLPPPPRRERPVRERLSMGIERGVRRGLHWAVAAFICGAIPGGLVGLHGFAMFFAFAGTAILSIVTGARMGRLLGGWVIAFFGGFLLPVLMVGMLFSIIIWGIMPAKTWNFFTVGVPVPTNVSHFVASALGYLGAATGALLSLRAIVRKRLRRIRTWQSFAKVIGSSVLGIILALSFSFLVFWLCPANQWTRTYAALVGGSFLALGWGGLGFIEGVTNGWRSRER